MTARMISSMVISPSVVESPAAQSDRGLVPRAMLTIMTSSSMVTSPSPLQSPGQRGAGVSVGGLVGDGVGVVVGVAAGGGRRVSVSGLASSAEAHSETDLERDTEERSKGPWLGPFWAHPERCDGASRGHSGR